MPELPELEVYRRNLHSALVGKSVDAVAVYRTKRTPAELEAALRGETLDDVGRHGKTVHFVFRAHRLAVHLMLRGRFELTGQPESVEGRRIALGFGARHLVVADPSGLATVTLDPPRETAPDALSPEFSPGYLAQALQKYPGKAVKTLLVDQDVVAGIGNTYADEILWQAEVAPQSLCGRLPADAVAALHGAIVRVLENAVARIARQLPEGVSGAARDFLEVHGKKRTPDGDAVLVADVGGKKSYYAERQRLYR